MAVQALGVCSQSDRTELKKKLKEMRKSEEKSQKEKDKRNIHYLFFEDMKEVGGI
jgi:hypothetical protein